jgi:hypothetical protein
VIHNTTKAGNQHKPWFLLSQIFGLEITTGLPPCSQQSCRHSTPTSLLEFFGWKAGWIIFLLVSLFFQLFALSCLSDLFPFSLVVCSELEKKVAKSEADLLDAVSRGERPEVIAIKQQIYDRNCSVWERAALNRGLLFFFLLLFFL